MSDVQNAAAEPAAKRAPKSYEGMSKAEVVADFKGSMEKSGLVLRVTKGELAAAAATLRGDKDFEPAGTNKAPVVAALVMLAAAVKQKEYNKEGEAKDAKGEPIFHKGAKGLDHLAENFGSSPTRNVMFDPAGAAKVINAIKGVEATVASLKTVNEARGISGNRAMMAEKAKSAAKAKSAGAGIGE